MSNFMLTPERFSSAAQKVDTATTSGAGEATSPSVSDRLSTPRIDLPTPDVGTYGGPGFGSEVMTVAGTARIASLLLACIAGAAAIGWQVVKVTETTIPGSFGSPDTVSRDVSVNPLVFVAFILAFGLVLFTSFKPGYAPFTSVPYALAEGFVLGAVSHLFEADSSGIVLQALIGTLAVFLGILFAYSTGLLRATPKFRRMVIMATFGIMCVYIVSFVGALLGFDISFWNQSGMVGVGISLFVCAIAALNLVLDFDLIEQGAARGFPKQMEWYAAFGLVVTLVWLYLEILRLLSRRD